MEQNNLIDVIEKFAIACGIAPATVTSKAVGNSRLYHRIKSGGSCTIKTADRLRQYMADHPASPEKERDAA